MSIAIDKRHGENSVWKRYSSTAQWKHSVASVPKWTARTSYFGSPKQRCWPSFSGTHTGVSAAKLAPRCRIRREQPPVKRAFEPRTPHHQPCTATAPVEASMVSVDHFRQE